MHMLTVILLSTLCIITASATTRHKRMVGAEFAHRGDFPFLVLVRRPDYECTGSIISPSWVLTAGHCLEEANPSRFKVTAGTVSDWYGGDERDEFVQHRRVTRTIIHLRYDRFTNVSIDTTFNDIGLMQMDKPFQMTKYVQSVPLSQFRPPYPKPCYAIGFGSSNISPEDWDKLKEEPSYPHRIKRSEPLRYYEAGVPQYRPPDYGPMPCRVMRDARFKEKYQLCTVGGAPNSTHLYVGDSGGPMVCNGVQVGVYVLSEPKKYDGSLHIIEVHTAVSSFIDWIKTYVYDFKLASPDWRLKAPVNLNDLHALTSTVGLQLSTLSIRSKTATGEHNFTQSATTALPATVPKYKWPTAIEEAAYSKPVSGIASRPSLAASSSYSNQGFLGNSQKPRTTSPPIRTTDAKFSGSNLHDSPVVFQN